MIKVRGRVEAYDLTNPALRAWWLGAIRDVCQDPVIDGVFLDGNVKVLEPMYLKAELGVAKKQALVAAYHQMMTETREVIEPQKLMLANLLRARFPDSGLGWLGAFDGTYVEGFEERVGTLSRADYVAKGLAAVQEAAQRRAIVAFTAGAGKLTSTEVGNPQRTDEVRRQVETEAQLVERFNYCLAMFLVCAEKHSYFLVHDGYDAATSKTWRRWPEEFDRPLGAPKGAAVRAGYTYTREFAHASVKLDIEKQTGSILWK